jgi:hypothetical protein
MVGCGLSNSPAHLRPNSSNKPFPGGQSRRAPHPPATNAVIGLIHRRYLRAICVPRCQSGGRRACLPGRAQFEVNLLAGDADLGQRQHCFCPPTQIRQRPRRQKSSNARWLWKGWSSREAAVIASAPLLLIACLLSRRRLPTLHTAQSPLNQALVWLWNSTPQRFRLTDQENSRKEQSASRPGQLHRSPKCRRPANACERPLTLVLARAWASRRSRSAIPAQGRGVRRHHDRVRHRRIIAQMQIKFTSRRPRHR